MSDKAIAKRLARAFAKKGLKYEKRFMKAVINDARVNFLRSPEDPLHGYYKQKLSEYQSQIQKNGAIVVVDDDDDDDEDDVVSTHVVIEPPPGIIRNDIEWMAHYISKWGYVAEKMMMQSEVNKARYSFMRRSDRFHPYYQLKLSEYNANQSASASASAAAAAAASAAAASAASYRQKITELTDAGRLPHLVNPRPIDLPNLLEVRLPKGMTIDEFETMKLTAQFGAWYGNDFWLGFKNKDGYEFTNPTDSRFPRFTRFVLEYSEVLKPPKGLKEKVSKNDAYMAAIHDGFFRLLESDEFLRTMEWTNRGVMSMIDWHASLDKDFPNDKDAHEEETETAMSPPEPESGLVPEDQFLAQHPGWCTIRVSIANIDDREALVIEKTVQSLSESLGSFKEKIAENFRIPPEKQLLFGKAGFLKENNRSLAHYNVGAGEILTLSLCACGRERDLDKPCRCREMLAKAYNELMLSYNSTFN